MGVSFFVASTAIIAKLLYNFLCGCFGTLNHRKKNVTFVVMESRFDLLAVFEIFATESFLETDSYSDLTFWSLCNKARFSTRIFAVILRRYDPFSERLRWSAEGSESRVRTRESMILEIFCTKIWLFLSISVNRSVRVVFEEGSYEKRKKKK